MLIRRSNNPTLNHHIQDGGGPDKNVLNNFFIHLVIWIKFIAGKNRISNLQIFNQYRASFSPNRGSGCKTRSKDLASISRNTNYI